MEIHINTQSGTYSDTANHLTTLYNWLSRISIQDMTSLEFDIKVDIVTKKKTAKRRKHHEQETEKEVPQG